MRQATLAWLALLLAACSSATPASDTRPGDVTPRPRTEAGGAGDGGAGRFLAGELLGRPTASSVAVSAVPDKDLEIYFEHGTSSGQYIARTPTVLRKGGEPFAVTLEGLAASTRHFYRMRWRAPGASPFAAGAERSFQTARPRGQPYVFTVQSDPHLDEISSLELYRRALENQLADAPDFMIDLGDTFMCEKHPGPLTATDQAAPDYPTVASRYLYERGNFGLVAHSAPLFLVNGNHEGEAGWLLTGSASSLAVWATVARKAYFPAPLPDAFYGGGATEEPFVGKRGSYYSWEWGDALFVVLDPYWYTTTKSKLDAWVWTLGQAQYQWLTTTLQKSSAPFRLVFLHNLVGGLDGLGRGGIEAAPYYEWGGKNADGSEGFAAKRPGWAKPIHQVLVENHVTAVFHGHDHVYVKQQLDGIVYQELPQPSAPNFTSGPNLAAKFHYASGTIVSSAGHLRVSVGPAQLKVEYVRAYRVQDETSARRNRDVSDSYTLAPR